MRRFCRHFLLTQDAVYFLASEGAKNITGVNIPVDQVLTLRQLGSVTLQSHTPAVLVCSLRPLLRADLCWSTHRR